jgi:transposase
MPGSAPAWRKRRSATPGSKSPGTGSQGRGQAALAAHHLERGLHLLPGRGKAWAAIPSDLKGGVIVHDGFVPYGALGQIDHALCNAHHLREPKALIERDGEAWATPMRDTLIAANAAVRKARDSGAKALAPDQVKTFVERYWEAVREGIAFHRALPGLEQSPQSRGRLKHRPGFNLLTRLKTFKDDGLRSLVDFDVPFTNNLAEQDIRMTKVKMKISGAFRTLAGARHFACLRSILSTARKQRYAILQILAATPHAISQAILQ